MLAPICLFTYNRLEETKQTIDALKKNYLAQESELFIFSDGPKSKSGYTKIQIVREYLKTISGFKNVIIIESLENKGLANSIVSGITQVIGQYGKVIVMEDDLVAHPYFLNYMNNALDFYGQNVKVQSINGFSPYIKECKKDIYFHQRPFSWGWATWIEYWDLNIFDKKILSKKLKNQNILGSFKNEQGNDISKMLLNSIQGKNDSWYVRWAYSHFENDNVSLYPKFSFIENIGFSENATHCTGIKTYKYKLAPIDLRNIIYADYKKKDDIISKEFLIYFTKRYRLKIRLKLLGSISGLKLLLMDVKSKL